MIKLFRDGSFNLGRIERLLLMEWDLKYLKKPLWGLDNSHWKERNGGGRLRSTRKLACRIFPNSRRNQTRLCGGFSREALSKPWDVICYAMRTNVRYYIITISSRIGTIFPSHFCCLQFEFLKIAWVWW